jgi:hypothetical protein
MMKRWRWTLLIFELVLFATILVLPQVDLPDFEFHGGSAPVTAKARVFATPVGAVISAVRFSSPEHKLSAVEKTPVISAARTVTSRLTLFCTLIC